MSRFIDTELKSDSEPSDSDSDLDSEKIGVKVDNNNIRKNLVLILNETFYS